MTQAGPQIGFDRFIHRDWISAALRIRAGLTEMQQLNELLASSHSGDAAKKKTRTVLNRLWLAPRPELIDFADRGVAIFRDSPDTTIAVLNWGMAIATYPFFGRVAEIVGRLTALQGDCASSEVHRRMTEIYGEREGTLRMTNMVLQSQASWGGIRRTEDAKRLVREPPTVLFESKCAAWLIEACVRYLGRPIAVSAVDSLPVKYPFSFSGTAATVAAASPSLELRTESSSTLLVSLREGRFPS